MKRLLAIIASSMLFAGIACAESPFGVGKTGNPFGATATKTDTKTEVKTAEVKTETKSAEIKKEAEEEVAPVKKKKKIKRVKKKVEPVEKKAEVINIPAVSIVTPDMEDIAKVKAMETMIYVAVAKHGEPVEAAQLGNVKVMSGTGYTAILVPPDKKQIADEIFVKKNTVLGRVVGSLGNLYVIKEM